VAIQNFRRSEIADFFFDGRTNRRAGWIGVAKVVARKLDMLHYAQTVADLRSPPANRLEALKGDLAGFFSVRVNDQWRIVFRWTSSGPEQVDVVDYHQ
jgi:proteic killer suppression protein